MHDHAQNRPQPAFDRRQVLRAGAWAAPVILVAAAAPAASASVVDGVLAFNNFSPFAYWSEGSVRGIQATTSVRLAAGTGTVDQITLEVIVDDPDQELSTEMLPSIVTEDTGQEGTGQGAWSPAGPGVRTGNDIVYTAVWVGTLGLNQSTMTLRATVFAIATLNTGLARPWTATAMADGAQSAVETSTVTPQ